MTASVSVFQRLPSIRTMVRACLLAQVGVAGLLVYEHVWTALNLPTGEPIRTAPTQPISPGDQSRPFQRVAVPGHEDKRLRFDSPIRLPEELPPKLTFRTESTEEFGEVLLATGSVAEGDALRFEAHLDSLTQPVNTVALHSPGGSVLDAQAIGRMIREAGLNTLISPDAACLSSCPYILSGGVERFVSRNGWVGLHQHYFDKNSILPSFLAVKSIQSGQGETMAYLDEMGVDPLVLIHALKTPPEDIYLLVEDELTEYRIATEVID